MVIYEYFIRFGGQLKVACSFDQSRKNTEEILKLGDWLTQIGLATCVHAEPDNGFFLLHGVTSAWTLTQVLPHLPCQDAMFSCRMFLVAHLNAFIIVECPELTKSPQNYWKGPANKESWNAIVSEVLGRDNPDVHMIKLVQVRPDIWLQHQDDEDTGRLCFAAAEAVCTHDYNFI